MSTVHYDPITPDKAEIGPWFFYIICKDCKSDMATVESRYDGASDETGIYGEHIRFTCKNCGRREDFYV